MISVCTGTACHVKDTDLVYDAFIRELNIEEKKDTDDKGEFTIQTVACLGCCTIAPVVQIDDITYGHVKSDNVDHVIKDFRSHKHGIIKSGYNAQVYAEQMGEIKPNCCNELKIKLGDVEQKCSEMMAM